MAAVIGALRVTLGANVAEFEQGLKRANRGLAGFAKSAKLHAAAAAAAFAAASAAFSVAVGRIINHADKLGKLSQSIGVPVDQLSRLTHAAQINAVSMDELGRTFRNVARNMQGAARAPTDFSRALDALGVSWRDTNGHFVRADALMLAVSDRFAGMQDGAGKTALAMKIFGEEMGPRIVPMLNLGADGIRQLTAEAKAFGLTISGETAKHAASFNDSMTRLSASARGMATSIATALLPTLDILAKALAGTASETSNVNRQFEVSRLIGLGMASVFIEIKLHISQALEVLKAFHAAFTRFLSMDFAGAGEALTDLPKRFAENTKAAREELAKLMQEAASAGEQFGPFRHEMTLAAAPIVASANALRNVNIELVRLKTLQSLGVDLTPWEQQRLAIERVNHALAKGRITAQQHGRAMQVAASTATSAWLGAVGEISGTLSNAFRGNKALAIATALINTAQGVTKALAQGGMFGWAQAAAIAAAGAAQVATIRSTNPGGGGAASSASGGGGGSESPTSIQQLHVSGVGNPDVRTLIDELLQKQRDGFQVMLQPT